MDYKKDTVLDTDNFDEEISKHGQRFMEYVEAAAEAEFEKGVAKTRIQIVRADVAKKIRSNPKKYGLDGFPSTVVEKMVKDAVEGHPKVMKADKYYLKKVKTSRILDAAAHAMGSYKKNSIQIHGQRVLAGFFSEPKINLDKKDYVKLIRSKDKGSVQERKRIMRKKKREE